MVLFGDNTKEQVPKADLTKLDGILVDEYGSIPITLWNQQIPLVEYGNSYIFNNLRVRQYMGEKYLATTPETTIETMRDVKQPNKNDVDQQLRHKIIHCTSFQSTKILQHYACLTCKKKSHSGKIQRCWNVISAIASVWSRIWPNH